MCVLELWSECVRHIFEELADMRFCGCLLGLGWMSFLCRIPGRAMVNKNINHQLTEVFNNSTQKNNRIAEGAQYQFRASVKVPWKPFMCWSFWKMWSYKLGVRIRKQTLHTADWFLSFEFNKFPRILFWHVTHPAWKLTSTLSAFYVQFQEAVLKNQVNMISRCLNA